MRILSSFALGLVIVVAAAAGDKQPGPAVGRDACTTCHGELASQFQKSVHSRLAKFETRGHLSGCESCHGPGTNHVQSGDAKQIFSFKAASDEAINGACLSCHAENVGHSWAGSEHSLNGIACTDCHKIHQSRVSFVTATAATPGMKSLHASAPPPKASLSKPEPQLCLDCHKEKRGQMMFTSHHPVREGKMQCSSCHQAHGSSLKQLRAEERVNDMCTSCHTAKQGPFVFEHAPVSESCLTCHEPHGTVANNLLRQNEPYLCLQCHEAHFHLGRSGATTAVATNSTVLPDSRSSNPFGEKGWRAAFGTKCTECHSQIHGTDLPSQSVPSGGKGFTR